MDGERMAAVVLVCIAVLVVGSCIVGGCYGYPKYRVWQQGLEGQAELKRAEMNRQIEVAQAQAHKEAATQLAAAEVERAKGVAQANEIIGDSLKGNDAYLRYLWIQGLNDDSSQVIYVPTEANLPILEATRGMKAGRLPETAASAGR